MAPELVHPIYTCLWFDNQAKEAATFYCGVFKDARILSENPIVVTFEIKGNKYMAINGGPMFKFNEAISLVVDCDTQDEIDYYWEHFTTNGGKESMCGWCKDKYGLSWQIVPTILAKLMNDPQTASGAMNAFMKMRKFDIERLIEATKK